MRTSHIHIAHHLLKRAGLMASLPAGALRGAVPPKIAPGNILGEQGHPLDYQAMLTGEVSPSVPAAQPTPAQPMHPIAAMR